LEAAMMEPNVQIVNPVAWLSSDFAALKSLHDEIVSLYQT
jgi:hypothetical protein